MIWIDSELVKELVCVKSQELDRNSWPYPRGPPSGKRTSCRVLGAAVARPAKREESGHDLLPLRVPHGLIRGFSRGSERWQHPERLFQ